MLTHEQIKWTASVFEEAGAILDKIPDISSKECYDEAHESNLTFQLSEGQEFFFVEDVGLYKLTDGDRGSFFQEVFGRTRKEIIQYLVDKNIDEASFRYASQKFWEEHPHSPWPSKSDTNAQQYYALLEEKRCYYHSLVASYINAIKEEDFPSSLHTEPLKLLKQGEYISLFTRGDKYIVKVSAPDTENFSHLYLCVLHEEDGYCYGVRIYINGDRTLDITHFYDSAEFLSLNATVYDRFEILLIERLYLVDNHRICEIEKNVPQESALWNHKRSEPSTQQTNSNVLMTWCRKICDSVRTITRSWYINM